MLRKAGMKLTKAAPVVCSYTGLIRSMDASKKPESGEYCFLDLGYQSIRMYMFKGERHMVTRVLEVGLNSLDQVLASYYNVDEFLAHTYLLTDYENCRSKEECIAAYNNIAIELMRAINFYRFSNPDSQLEDIWITGGGAAIEPLKQVIQETLDMKLHEAHELLPGGQTSEEDDDILLQAIGITLD